MLLSEGGEKNQTLSFGVTENSCDRNSSGLAAAQSVY